ncbi:cation diffusion facilitator family transporter [Salinispira pacifica]
MDHREQSSHGPHDGGAHDHGVSADADRRYVALALGLIVAFMAAEVVVGFLASSLALISDAGHMLTDAGALALALVTIRLSKRPPAGIMTYGLKRTEIISAQVNGTTLLVLAALFIYEGVRRLIQPPEVKGGLVLIVGLAGIVVNLLATLSLAKANRSSLNIRGSFQHILTDLFAFIATSIAGGIIYFTHSLYRLDAVAAFVVAALMIRAGSGLVRDAMRVLLEAAPKGMDPDVIQSTLLDQPDVISIEDFHVWEITSGFPALSAHVRVEDGIDCHAKRRDLTGILSRRFDIDHTTLQVDHRNES